MGGRQIIRIENSDSDLRFRDKVNRNFSTLMQSTAVERALADPSALENVIAVLQGKADQADLDALEDRVAELEYVKHTPEGGIAIRLTNGTGATSVKGSVVAVSTTDDNRFILQDNEYDSIGVVYEAGVANGASCWVVIAGRAEMLFENDQSPVRGQLIIAAATNGRVRCVAVPSSNPVVGEHFKECGHCMESKSGGTNVLAFGIIHFN